jgi:hypothetical protein
LRERGWDSGAERRAGAANRDAWGKKSAGEQAKSLANHVAVVAGRAAGVQNASGNSPESWGKSRSAGAEARASLKADP